MQSAQLVLALLIAVAVLVTIARRLGIAYPIFPVIGGLLLGLVPGLPRVQVDPELMYLVVLPGADEALLRLRAEGAIDDDVLREVERELDLEERRMDA